MENSPAVDDTPASHPVAGHVHLDVDQTGPRAVAFPPDDIREEKIIPGTRPKGVEMKRTLTQEEKDLAAAGYDHLRQPQTQKEAENTDIHEHQYGLEQLADELKTNFDTKDPGHSFGLTTDDSKTRLKRDGPNILTPPKKKSAFRKVCLSRFLIMSFLNPNSS